MSDAEIPQELMYTSSHEWVRDNNDGTVTIGITDHAATALGDLVYVELPEDDAELEKEGAAVVVESVKAASDVYSPLTGQVVGVNEDLADSPELINESPYEDGWIFQLKVEDGIDTSHLLNAEDYAAQIADE